MTEDDVQLIRNARHGNREAFSQIVTNYKAFVYRTAYGIVHHQADAEDVTQETFMKVYQSLKKLRDEYTFPSWLARITVRTAIDWKKRHQRHDVTALEETQVVSNGDSHKQVDARLDLEQAIHQLAEDHQTVLVLRELHGFNYEELASILDIPVGTVRSRLHHARLQLRQGLLKEGGLE